MFRTDSVFAYKMEDGYHVEDWMDLPEEEGTYVISLPNVTSILSASATLTINIEEDEVSVPEVTRLRHPIEAQPITSVSVSSQPTYLLPSSIKSRVIGVDLERIRTLFGISYEYQIKVTNPKKQVD